MTQILSPLILASMASKAWMSLSFICAFSKFAFAGAENPCAKIEDRIFEVSGSYTILGDKWLWTDSNVIADRAAPFFKEVVVKAFKSEGQWDAVKMNFDKAFSENAPEFMANIFIMFAGLQMKNRSIGFKDSRWLYFDRNHVCKTAPLECFAVSNPSAPLKEEETKKALAKFYSVLKLNRIDDFCSDIAKKRDPVFSGYAKKIVKCAKPKWASLEQYCLSIEKALKMVSASLR